MPEMCQIEFPNPDMEESGIAELMSIRDSLKIVQNGQYVITKKNANIFQKKT